MANSEVYHIPRLVYTGTVCSGPPGSSRRAGGFSLVLRPTTTGGSFWEFDCFTPKKRRILAVHIGTHRDRHVGRSGTGGILRLCHCGSGFLERSIAEQEAAQCMAILHGHGGSHGGGPDS